MRKVRKEGERGKKSGESRRDKKEDSKRVERGWEGEIRVRIETQGIEGERRETERGKGENERGERKTEKEEDVRKAMRARQGKREAR